MAPPPSKVITNPWTQYFEIPAGGSATLETHDRSLEILAMYVRGTAGDAIKILFTQAIQCPLVYCFISDRGAGEPLPFRGVATADLVLASASPDTMYVWIVCREAAPADA